MALFIEVDSSYNFFDELCFKGKQVVGSSGDIEACNNLGIDENLHHYRPQHEKYYYHLPENKFIQKS